MTHYFVKVFHVCAEDSPNVKLARQEIAQGESPSNTVVIPGILTWEELCEHRATWDELRQRIGLDGLFPDDSRVFMYPKEWLLHSQRLAEGLPAFRRGKSMGIDPAEGGDKSAFAIGDDVGLIDLISLKTPDTTKVPDLAIGLGHDYGVPPENWIFDRGGGGKQHADRLRLMGYPVRSLAFGEKAQPEIKRLPQKQSEKRELRETKSIYRNMRAELYYEARIRMNPLGPFGGYAVPARFVELFRQLKPIPILYDDGQLFLLPKNKKDRNDTRETLTDLIGHSPDEADAYGLMHYGLRNPGKAKRGGK